MSGPVPGVGPRPLPAGGHRPGAFVMLPADVSHIRRKWLDVPYATVSPAQKLDVFLPAVGEGPFPVVVHLHGGAFAMGDKRDAHLQAWLTGVQRGYAVVSVNYRLSGEAIFPAGIQDVKAAIRWLRANAAAYHLDGDRIAACGGSSGGNYAAMICLSADVPELEDRSLGNPDTPCHVQAGVDLFGPMDFLRMDDQLLAAGLGPADHQRPDSPESRYLGAPIASVPDLVRRANPITYIHPDMPPILIQHGRMDHLVPVGQSIMFAEALNRGVGRERFEFDILETADHADPLFETPANLARIFAFLDKHLR
jgi:acetyl esterase/lipase